MFDNKYRVNALLNNKDDLCYSGVLLIFTQGDDMDKILFSRPLILGASISAGYKTQDGGPGTILARLINPAAQITNLAFNGATSVQSTTQVDFNSYNPSIVLGFDLFFWDAARGQVGPKFEANTRRFFKFFHERKIPMIIGKLPIIDLPFGPQAEIIKESAKKVNSLLEEICTLENNTLLYDPLDCLLNMNSPDYFSDSLHLTNQGNEFCARFLAREAAYKKLKVMN